jgi:hypothetical protein
MFGQLVQTPTMPGPGAPAASLATQWRVETVSGGTCVVRMVMSGFGSGAAWDREIQALTEGMRKALESLGCIWRVPPPRTAPHR